MELCCRKGSERHTLCAAQQWNLDAEFGIGTFNVPGDSVAAFEAEGGLLRKVLDHMVENGDMAPTIVVSPSYNYGQPTSSYVDADPYCLALPHELVNDLIPLVETRYRTISLFG